MVQKSILHHLGMLIKHVNLVDFSPSTSWCCLFFGKSLVLHCHREVRDKPGFSNKISSNFFAFNTHAHTPLCSKYPLRRCLGTQNPLQNHLQKGLEHRGTTRGGYHDCQTVTVTIWWLQRLLSAVYLTIHIAWFVCSFPNTLLSSFLCFFLIENPTILGLKLDVLLNWNPWPTISIHIHPSPPKKKQWTSCKVSDSGVPGVQGLRGISSFQWRFLQGHQGRWLGSLPKDQMSTAPWRKKTIRESFPMVDFFGVMLILAWVC